MTAPPLALSVWGRAEALPSLEPGSLYASALLQLALAPGHALYTLAPRGWPHPDTVPCLYAVQAHQDELLVGDPLATTPDAIRDYLREHSPLDADPATAAVTALSAHLGAWCVRVHEVAVSRDAVDVAARWRHG